MTQEPKDNCELQSAQEEVAKRAGHGTWENLLEQDSYDHSNMMGHWEEVARLLSYRVQDFRMAFEPWGKVIDHVQHNHPPGLKLGSSIAEYVLKLVKLGVSTDDMKRSYDDGFKEGQQDVIHRNLDVSTAYNLGYQHASKKAIEIITKGL